LEWASGTVLNEMELFLYFIVWKQKYATHTFL